MNIEILNQVITRNYQQWLRYARKMAADHHLGINEPDVVHQVFLDILDRNFTKDITLTSVHLSEEENIKRYVQRAIRTSIISPSSYANRAKKFEQKTLVYDLDFSLYNSPEPDNTCDNRLDLIWKIFEQLTLTDYQRQVFISHFRDELTFEECKGEFSYSTCSRACRNVCKKIRSELRHDKTGSSSGICGK